MAVKLKKIKDQVMVITGASSGIGLATAQAAAERGAQVVLAARSGNALEEIARNIEQKGGAALAVECDVADRKQVERLAQRTMERFGRIDTWINNAGQGLWARLDQSSEEDGRRLFDINFWGVVHGSRVALPYLKKQGGALINVGSEVSEAVAPLLGLYVASKHAVKGYTDVLRVELEELDQAPVSITLIEPTAVDTPFPQHARNVTGQEAQLPKPLIEPEKVAAAILETAENPTREKRVGAMAVVNTLFSKLIPGMGEKAAAKKEKQLHTDQPPRDPEGILYRSSEAAGVVAVTHGAEGRGNG